MGGRDRGKGNARKEMQEKTGFTWSYVVEKR
jgi:hypothetical protein